ncbi:hypothetical protein C1645_814845 [Glomus cerebriforme]|uniref:MULE transposase domain-containing protein n=1 Tax=Glomus cerebriforme TaxID=658196 RepID=A0A397THG3_9GLOM|nr:hypothetical protein C1645_814845 [Glomus cerebriforme]
MSLFSSKIPMEKKLSIGCRFDTWIVAENTIKEYGKRKGFAINRHQVKYSKNQITNSGKRVVRKRTYVCKYFEKYKPNKENPIEQQYLSNAIQKIKRKHQIIGLDASCLLKFLLKKQKEDLTIFVQPLINVNNDRLCGIFWITSNQILLWSHYSDIIILYDNTLRTNKYNYPLSLFILVDNNEDANNFDNDQMDQEDELESNQEEANNIEDYYDYRQTYLKLMVENSNALFHLLLMPTRWLQDNAWNHVDIISNKPFIGTSSKNLKQLQDNNTVQQANFIPMHYDNIQEVQIRKDNNQQNLDDIILAYISEKQAKWQALVQLI